MTSASHPPLPPPHRRFPALDRPRPVSPLHRCWWVGHRWDYRTSTRQVILQFRQCLRCSEVEIG